MVCTFHHGEDDGLEPLKSLSLEKVENFSDLLKQMSDTAFGGRELGKAYHVLLKMIRDPECRVVFTMSGAMGIAKMGKIVCDMIENEFIHMIITTGAIMAHGLTESTELYGTMRRIF
jgi:deoxyhypusine synthase